MLLTPLHGRAVRAAMSEGSESPSAYYGDLESPGIHFCDSESPSVHFRESDGEFLQKQAKVWLEALLGERYDEGSNLADLLADGDILHRVSKVIRDLLQRNLDGQPVSPKSLFPEAAFYGKSSGKYLPYSNVDSFLKVCQKLGLTAVDLFSPPDVVEKRDIRRVCLCIRALSKKTQARHLDVPDFDYVSHTVAMPTVLVGVLREYLQQAGTGSNGRSPVGSSGLDVRKEMEEKAFPRSKLAFSTSYAVSDLFDGASSIGISSSSDTPKDCETKSGSGCSARESFMETPVTPYRITESSNGDQTYPPPNASNIIYDTGVPSELASNGTQRFAAGAYGQLNISGPGEGIPLEEDTELPYSSFSQSFTNKELSSVANDKLGLHPNGSQQLMESAFLASLQSSDSYPSAITRLLDFPVSELSPDTEGDDFKDSEHAESPAGVPADALTSNGVDGKESRRGLWMPVLVGTLALFGLLCALRSREPSVYKVQKGDTLSEISRRTGKSGWEELVRLNPGIKNPDLIYPSERLRLHM